MTIAVVGLGAVGLTAAATLSSGGRHDLLLCARSLSPKWICEREGETIDVHAPCTQDPASTVPVDWVLFATKAHQTAGAASWLRALVGSRTVVAVLQNGIDHEARIRPHLGHSDATVLPVVVRTSAQRIELGRVRTTGDFALTLPDTAAARGFAELFAGTSAAVEHRVDFENALWEKLCVNAVGGIAAVLDAPLDLRTPSLAALVRAMVAEIALVARAEGVLLDPALGEALVSGYRNPDARPNSILADRRAGRALEVSARNEVIVERARKHGLDVPVNATVAALLRAISERLAPS